MTTTPEEPITIVPYELKGSDVEPIAVALGATLARACDMSKLKDETLHAAIATAITAFVWRQGSISPNIPLTVTRTLMHAAVDHGYAKVLGLEEVEGKSLQ
jgi:hypothetical protein